METHFKPCNTGRIYTERELSPSVMAVQFKSNSGNSD